MTQAELPLEVDCRTVESQLAAGDVVLVDCREQVEYDHVRIDGSLLLPMSEIQQRLTELDAHRQQHLVVHCHHGGRSLQVTNWLREQGFDRVQSMAGGIDQWAQEIDPSLPRY